jgi:hypothetical protein
MWFIASAVAGTGCKANSMKSASASITAAATVAVLPVEGTIPARGRMVLRELVRSLLQDKHYATIDPAYLDSELARAGIQPWNERWFPGVDPLLAVAKRCGADAIVRLYDVEDDRVSAGVYYRRGLVGKLSWIDRSTKGELFHYDFSAAKSGGVFLESGQIVKAIAHTTANGSEEQFAELAAEALLDVLEPLPESARPAVLRTRPVISDFVLSSTGDLAPGSRWSVEVKGTPGCRGAILVSGLPWGELPLHESEPGLYKNEFRVEAGAGEGRATLSAVLYNSAGDPSGRGAEATLAVRAPRVDPPTGLSVGAADRTTRSVALLWDAAVGADGYEVVRLSPGAAPVSFRCRQPNFTDRLPDGVESAAYAVSVRPAHGAAGPTSAPVFFTFSEPGASKPGAVPK